MDIEKIQKEYHQKVKLCCDEYHQHSFEKGCYCGDEKDLLILLLCERFLKLNRIIETFNHSLERI